MFGTKEYEEGTFGHWWTILGNDDIEGKVYDGDIDCSGQELTSLEGCPRKVLREFNCSSNKLETLEGGPQETGRNYTCHLNGLKSLKGGPKIVKGYFGCTDNQLETLEGGPEIIEGSYDCSDNILTTLKGAPKKTVIFWCQNNHLKNLIGAPNTSKIFDCSRNDLDSLEGFPKEYGESFIYDNSRFRAQIKIEFELRKENPNLSDEEIFTRMFEKTQLPQYLPKETKKIFLF